MKMPRTKRATVSRQDKEETVKKTKIVQAIRNQYVQLLDNIHQSINEHIDKMYMARKLKIPHKYRNMLVRDLRNVTSFETTLSCTTLSVNTTTKKNLRRSKSVSNDEGYLTGDNASTGSTRESRSRLKIAATTNRRTRSLSKTEKKLAPPSKINLYKTPMNKMTTPNSYGLVTPKCKPNTPQVLLRRPKHGEMALSMAGSPLLAAPMLSEQTANINIPFNDGNVLSLLPQPGLRLSQIPPLDKDTLKQLDLLQNYMAKIVQSQH